MHRVASRICTATLLLSAGFVQPASALPTRVAQVVEEVPVVAALRGRVTLTDGSVVEGYLTWDRHASTPADLLRGRRQVSEEGLRLRTIVSERTAAERRRSVDLPGVRVTWEEDDPDLTRLVQAGIRFARIERLVPEGDTVRVHLRAGETVDLQPLGTSFGRRFRGLAVDRPGVAVRTLEWGEIAEVAISDDGFADPPARHRIHGTVETTSGETFTGWIVWDADEVWGTDVLDGDVDSVRFDELTGIERLDGGGVEVVLSSGERRMLRGTNDVDEGNRGIRVSDPNLGSANVMWESFATLRLHPPAVSRAPDSWSDEPPASTSTALEGAVTTRDGVVLTGTIVWDLDESRAWHTLDGEADGVTVALEFSEVTRIERLDEDQGVLVVLRDGRRLNLVASNDVTRDNHGVGVIDAAGESRIVEWEDFASLDLNLPRRGG